MCLHMTWVRLKQVGGWEGNAVNGFRERIEQIQAKIKREKSRSWDNHPFNPSQKSVDSPRQQRGCLLTLTPNSF
jgi:hypothetical protein